MEKLLQKYKEECAISSKVASIIWKIGIILIAIIYIYKSYSGYNYFIGFLLASISIGGLYIICVLIFRRKIYSKIYNIQERKIKYPKLKKLYSEIDKYQKGWMTTYCRKNKINKIEKLEILRLSLIEQEKNKTINYINPIIIGTLTLTIWEIILQRINENAGIMSMIVIAIVTAVVLSVIIGLLKKGFLDNKEMLLEFDRFADNKRLESLLLYEILKCKK